MSRAIRLAVASGKGGTGKTTVATNLAVVLAETGIRTAYADCDVEEPNGHLFLRPTIHATHDVTIPVPEVDETRCTLCGACGAACRYSAIVTLPNQVRIFPRLCHGCGGCTLACPTGAIRETPRVTGAAEEGVAGQVLFVGGKLNVGEAMAPPVVRAVLEAAPDVDTLVLDAPPGTSCPAIASVRTADVVLLVTEPTPFGLSDLRLAVQMVRELDLPFGVAVNRAGAGDRAVYEYCAAEGISVLLEIPNDRRIAQAYSRGQLCSDVMVELKPRWLELYTRLRDLVRTHRPRSVARPAIIPPDDAGGETLASELTVLGRKRRELDELVVNKADLNPYVADAIDAEASRWGMRVLGRVRYDEAVTAAQVSQRTVVEQGDSPASLEIRALWTRVRAAMATRVSARAGGPLAPTSERVMR
jgi:MinD superfamily P-loop ATPase